MVEEFGGPCRGRTYGPLIKSGKARLLRMLAIATVSPRCVAIPTRQTLLFILLFPMFSPCSHIFRSQKWSESYRVYPPTAMGSLT